MSEISRCEARWPECTWVSMNPGATSLSRASISRSTAPSKRSPTNRTPLPSNTSSASRQRVWCPPACPTSQPQRMRVRMDVDLKCPVRADAGRLPCQSGARKSNRNQGPGMGGPTPGIPQKQGRGSDGPARSSRLRHTGRMVNQQGRSEKCSGGAGHSAGGQHFLDLRRRARRAEQIALHLRAAFRGAGARAARSSRPPRPWSRCPGSFPRPVTARTMAIELPREASSCTKDRSILILSNGKLRR